MRRKETKGNMREAATKSFYHRCGQAPRERIRLVQWRPILAACGQAPGERVRLPSGVQSWPPVEMHSESEFDLSSGVQSWPPLDKHPESEKLHRIVEDAPSGVTETQKRLVLSTEMGPLPRGFLGASYGHPKSLLSQALRTQWFERQELPDTTNTVV